MDGFARIMDGREDWPCGVRIPRHRHDRAYAALVVSGAYEECGSRGRFRVGPGDVLLHDRFDAHLDRIQGAGARILNLLLQAAPRCGGLGRVDDPDAIMRAAERDPAAARAQFEAQLREATSVAWDWPDELANDLLDDSGRRLGDWARARGLAAETVSRGFARVFGVTPAAFRLEARTRRAYSMIADGEAPLAEIAAAAGFSDQAHMTRAVRALTGAPPGRWRRSNPFKTAVDRAG